MLNIRGIYIRKGCNYVKCLQTDTYYPLENKMPEDFFAPNVSVTTIVGQNGAGKSSLLDLLFRILNNIGYCLYSHVERNAADDLALKDGYQHILGIDKLYEYHNDIVMDIIVRKAVEMTAQRLFYQEGMKVDKAYIDRYITAIYGYEPDPKEDKRRVMSKFLRDVIKQIDTMIGYYLSEKKTELQTKPAIS